jgi:Icc-related predicted phosphoesterase
MIIDCISDLHGSYPKLEGGDLLIIAGDLTARDRLSEFMTFFEWIKKQEYKKIVIICGNHDKYVMKVPSIMKENLPANAEYLLNSDCEYDGFHIWGSPNTLYFDGVNPDCNAFMLRLPGLMKEVWDTIPYNTDILVTHGPPRDILDHTRYEFRVGCEHLRDAVERIKPKLHVFGHIHEGYGIDIQSYPHDNFTSPIKQTTFVNCAHMNVDYCPINKPVRIVL